MLTPKFKLLTRILFKHYKIELFYLQGKTYKDIASQHNMQIGKVRSFIQNGRRNLKICMERKVLKGEE